MFKKSCKTYFIGSLTLGMACGISLTFAGKKKLPDNLKEKLVKMFNGNPNVFQNLFVEGVADAADGGYNSGSADPEGVTSEVHGSSRFNNETKFNESEKLKPYLLATINLMTGIPQDKSLALNLFNKRFKVQPIRLESAEPSLRSE